MKKNLRDTLFGFRTRQSAEAFAAFQAANAQPVFNEAGTTVAKRRTPRIIGVTEGRLRARHQAFWLTDAKAWQRLFVRFMPRRLA